ncbi:MAG: MipA/OmpV family protein [Pontiellaceae bacterium]|nr:MipA/OmpV family protein [Pontiellaceae bacterium]
MNKVLYTALVCYLVSLSSLEAAELRIRLENPPSEGEVVFQLYDSPNTFGDFRDPVIRETAVLDGRSEYIITDIPPAQYALLAYYDENGNAQIDKNFIGIPREPLGFPNAYRPKGPPSYARAAVTVNPNDSQVVDVELYRALGERGRIGIGPGLLWQSSPYKGYDGGVYQFIPAITYIGERIQWFGPQVQVGLIGSGTVRLAATGAYRIGPYKEEDSNFLLGMGDAEDTFMAGLALEAELFQGIDLSVGASADVLDQIGGLQARCRLNKAYQLGILRVSPNVALNWMDSAMAENDYGVPVSQATAWRPAYNPGSSFSTETGVGLSLEITSSWQLNGNIGIEWLDSSATQSPILEEDYLLKGYVALSYLF